MKNPLVAAILGVSGATSWAADPVTDAMQAAYVPYRIALFSTNSHAQAESQKAMEQTQQSWVKLTEH